jgi:hypothetical protein
MPWSVRLALPFDVTVAPSVAVVVVTEDDVGEDTVGGVGVTV